MNILEVKNSQMVTADNDIIVCDSASPITMTLKSAVGKRDMFYIKNIGAGDVTIAAQSGQTIDGATTKVLAQYTSAVVLDYKQGIWIVI